MLLCEAGGFLELDMAAPRETKMRYFGLVLDLYRAQPRPYLLAAIAWV